MEPGNTITSPHNYTRAQDNLLWKAKYLNPRHSKLQGKQTNVTESLFLANMSFTYHVYKNFSMLVVKVDLGTAPITVSFFSPFLNIMTVGMLLIPYLVAIEGLSSVLTL